MLEHVAVVHENLRFECNLCSSALRSSRSLTRHKKLTHQVNDNNEPIELIRFKCEFCPKNYAQKSKLTRHVNEKHQGIRRYFCQTCKKGFYMQSGLVDHMVIHTRKKPHACPYCDATFGYRESRSVHYKYCKAKKNRDETLFALLE